MFSILDFSSFRKLFSKFFIVSLSSHSWHTSSRQGHFSPSLSQNRAWKSPFTRLFSLSIRKVLHIIELNLIVRGLLPVVFLSANQWAEPFAPFPLQKLHNYYDSVRHSTAHQISQRYLELHQCVRLIRTSQWKFLTFPIKACVEFLPPQSRLTCNQYAVCPLQSILSVLEANSFVNK